MNLSFQLSKSFLDTYRNKTPDWGPLGELVYKRTYCREGEEWWSTAKRVINGIYSIQKDHCEKNFLPWSDSKAQRSAEEMYDRMFRMLFLPSGRGLWSLGTESLEKNGGAILSNCAFVSTEDLSKDFASPFIFEQEMSMFGVGCGTDVFGSKFYREDPVIIHPPEWEDKTYVIEDSREGWVSLIRKVLNSFVKKDKFPLNIDYSLIRQKGEPLKTFGGVASGYEPLEKLIENIKNTLFKTEPYEITSEQIADLMNYLGVCTVSGGIRRVAQIILGGKTDKTFINLKDDREALVSHRWASNNSILAEVGMDYSYPISKIIKGSDIGFFWRENARRFSRTIDPEDWVDKLIKGVNPCGEQSLENKEICNVPETFPSRHETFKDYKRTLKFAYLLGKTISLVPIKNDREANAVLFKNRRIGLSQSGITQAINRLGKTEYFNWCNQGYKYLRELDDQYSNWLCVPKSIKITTVKPSGSVSLLPGVTPGIHFPHSKYYIRNIRINDKSELIPLLKDSGYQVEKDTYAPNTIVVSIPVEEDHYTRGKNEVSIWEQFANVAALQKYWSDNQVSATVTFKEEEEDQIIHCLETYQDQLKSISLLPLATNVYKQAPYISITEEEYNKLTAQIKPMNLSKRNYHEEEEKFCSGDRCEVVNKKNI